MHKLLSLWKEQGGRGSFESVIEEDVIRMLEIAVNALAGREIRIIVPPYKYFTYRRYFSNILIKWSEIPSMSIAYFKYHAIFVVDADDMPIRIADMFQHLQFKYLLCACRKFDNLTPYFKDVARLINFKQSIHKEYNYIIPMDADTQERYDMIIGKMKDIITIFRDYSNITGCIAGNAGLSASLFRERFANENGWHKELNINIPMFADIDRYYNPDNLFDQAIIYNKLVLERERIIAKSDDKVRAATAVVVANKYKKILVLAKGDDMCEHIAGKLKRAKVKVEAVHANTKSRTLTDDDGNVITVKTGKDKGKPKSFGTKSVNDSLLAQFNADKLRVIVSTGTIDKHSKMIGLDLIIMVSPKANNYYELKSRIDELSFKGDIIVVNIAFDIDKDLAVIKRKQSDLCLSTVDVFNLPEIIL